MDTNGVAMARHGLILSQDGATASRKLFKGLRGLFYIIFWLKFIKLTPGPKHIEKIRIFRYVCGPVYFPLKGEPWARVVREFLLHRRCRQLSKSVSRVLFGAFHILCLVTHIRAIHFLAVPYCREFCCRAFWVSVTSEGVYSCR